jgi:uncharacterized membrane protein YccC
MTAAAPSAVPAPEAPAPPVIRWLRSKDPELLVVKRSLRATIVMPSVFGIAHGLWSNAQVDLFAAFGSIALLLLVEFTGSPRSRVASYAGLYVVSGGLIAVGTVASTHEAAAVITMFVVGFGVLFAGIVAPQVATASTAVLLTFVLPVAVAEPASQVGWRLLGWTLAALASITACLLLWPPPWHDNLRRRLAATISSVARLAYGRAHGDDDPDLTAAVSRELKLLRAQFSATPYPPTGAASAAVALSKLVGRVEWVTGTAMLGDEHWSTESPAARRVTEQVADTLDRAAALLCDTSGHPVTDPARIAELQHSTRRLDELIGAELHEDVTNLASSASDIPTVGDESIASSLDPGFHARGLGIGTEMVADAALEAAGAEGVLDRQMAARTDPHSGVHRLVSHLSFRSIWFRNALRGAFGLALAVTVVELTNVQHGFWVVLGTLSVLRSSALGTGANALRAVGGTAVGVVVGSAIMVGVADHSVLLWVLLPLAVFVAGTAPSMIGFATGQAAFTLTVIILFNIIEPVGWRVGLTRIEDVAIGCGVSVVVGLLFWPRGATAALGRALSTAFVASSGYLADAVDRLTTTAQHIDTGPGQRASHRAYLLADDAFRQFLAERGAKVVPVETVARLFSGSNRLRLAGYTLAALPVRPSDPGRPEIESVAIAEALLRDSYASSHHWYQSFAELLAGQRDGVDQRPPHSEVLRHALRTAFDDVRTQRRDDRVQTTLQMLWADELLENQRQLQTDLLASADLFVHKHRGRFV